MPKTTAKPLPKISILPKPAFTPSAVMPTPPPVSAVAPVRVAEPIASIKDETDVDSTPLQPTPAKVYVQPKTEESKIAIVARNWRYIGCYKKRYAMFETAKALVVMSISDALKRVRYEEILKSLRGAEVLSQSVLIPIPLKFERGDDEYFSANRTAFETCGFKIEDFGKSFYRIIGVPVWLKYSDAENFIRDFVAIARDENKTLKKTAMSDENFAKALVERTGSASFDCNEHSAMELLANLLSSPNHMSSPTGAPTLKEIFS